MKPFYKAAAQLSLFLILFVISSNLYSQPPTISFQPIVSSGLSAPIDIVNAGDGSNRLFIVQQNGVIWVREGIAPFSVWKFADLGSASLPD